MFDRLTDGARKCMGLARQESQRLRHECIAPEHILLAIVLDAESTACIVLRSLQVEPARLQVSVLGRVERGDTVTGFGQVPFTPAAKRVLEGALDAQMALADRYIGTEHLLMGLLRLDGGPAHAALVEHGVTLEAAREAVSSVQRTRDAEDSGPEPLPRSIEEVRDVLEGLEAHAAFVLSEIQRLRDALEAIES